MEALPHRWRQRVRGLDVMQRYEGLIQQLEEQFEVNKLKYKGYAVWPLIRILLFYNANENAQNDVSLSSSKPAANSLKVRLGNLLWSLKNLNLTRKEIANFERISERIAKEDPQGEDFIRKADVVFVHYQLHRNQKKGQLFYNPFLHPIEDELKAKHSTLNLEQIEWPNTFKMPRYGKSFSIGLALKKVELEMAKGKLKSNFLFFIGLKGKATIEGLDELRSFLPEELASNIIFSHKFLVNEMHKMLHQRDVFKRLFQRIKPKVVFQASFYHSVGMALNLACRELNIKSVDVQHGILEPMAYWGYRKNSAQGYNMLPQYFWLWDVDSLETIGKWKDNSSEIILGGNVWMKKMLEKNFQNESLINSLEQLKRNFETSILFSLQSLHEVTGATIPDFVFDLMRKRKDILWMLRLHPRCYSEEAPDLDRKMKALGIENYELKMASQLPLTDIIRKADIHITAFSAVVFEAMACDIPTIFIDSYAGEIYSRDYTTLWNSGMIQLATGALDLENAINHCKKNKNIFDSTAYFGKDSCLESFEKICSN